MGIVHPLENAQIYWSPIQGDDPGYTAHKRLTVLVAGRIER